MAKQQIRRTFCLLAVLIASVAASSQDATHIPVTHGTTLSGTQVTLPDALQAKLNIVVIGFSHASQEQIGSWGRLIAADYGKSTDINYFELAMLARAPKLMRGMIVKSMGSSVPFDERAHFIPVMEPDQPWRTVAHYDKSDDAYILLVDSKGTVLWQTEGEPSNAAYGAFKNQVTKTLRAESEAEPVAPRSNSPH
jgi:hypothetical protein